MDSKSRIRFLKTKPQKTNAETEAGKKKIDSFLNKYEQALKGALSYNYVREQLGIPLKEKANKNSRRRCKSFYGAGY